MWAMIAAAPLANPAVASTDRRQSDVEGEDRCAPGVERQCDRQAEQESGAVLSQVDARAVLVPESDLNVRPRLTVALS